MIHLVHPQPFVLETSNPAELCRYRDEFERLLPTALGLDGDTPSFEQLVDGMQRDYRSTSFVLIAHPRRRCLSGLFPLQESNTFAGLPVEHPIVRVQNGHRPCLPLLDHHHAGETLHAFLRWLTESEWRADIVTFDGVAHHREFGEVLKRYCAENHPLTAIITHPGTPNERVTVALSTIGSLLLTGSRCLERVAETTLDTKKARPFGRARATLGEALPATP